MKSHNNAVVIIPPEDVWEPIQAIRSKHDRAFWRWMPHITLIHPFRKLPEHPLLKKHFEEQLFSFTTFEIHLKSVQYFMHKSSGFTIWLDPEPSPSIIQLQAEIQQIVPDCNDVHLFPAGFHPHLTIASGKGVEQFSLLLNAIKKQWKPLSFKVSNIYLLHRGKLPEDRFIISEVVKLS
ncbi:MAG: 2'-5' RNA ligase family protein [Calditrichaeota bacterium]|nr:MAG: 2'-5' RNA ligase family protein [Calditrichota bacterium]